MWTSEFWRARDGASMHVWRRPASRPTRKYLVFAHATGLNGKTYQSLLNGISNEVEIWAWDMRGHGQSERGKLGAELQHWQTYYEDLAELVDYIGENCVLCGHSVGGAAAAAAASMRPKSVEGLLLLDPVILGGQYSFWAWLGNVTGKAHQHPMAVGARRRREFFDSKQAVFDSYHGRSIFKRWPDKCLSDYVEAGFESTEDGRVRLLCKPEFEAQSFARTEFRPWKYIRQLSCPVRILGAEKNSTFLKPAESKILRRFPQTTVIRPPGSTHMLPFSHTEHMLEQLKLLFDAA